MSVSGNPIIYTISFINGKFLLLPVNGLAVGKDCEGKGLFTSSYSTIPNPFHSPNSLKRGWV